MVVDPRDVDGVEEELPKLVTPCTPQQMLLALGRAWVALKFSLLPSKGSLYVLLAQWALETGWGKSCWCWNIGNFKHRPGDGRDFTYYKCDEIEHGVRVWYSPDVPWQKPYCCFRAYRSIEGGAIDYLASLRKTFSKAWLDVVDGNPEAFAHDLKLQNYYTAPENDTVDPATGEVRHGYKWSVHSLFHSFADSTAKVDGAAVIAQLIRDEQESPFTDEEQQEILALVSRTRDEYLQGALMMAPAEDDVDPVGVD